MSKRIRQKIDIWAERDYIDFWSFVHFLTGVLFGYVHFIFNLPLLRVFLLAVVLFILWEVFELIKGIRETKKNRVIDIMIGIIGFGFTTYAYPLMDQGFALSIGIVALFLNLFLNTMGYVLYKLRLRP